MGRNPGTRKPKFKPTVTTVAASNFNESRVTFNATVSANYYPTTVYFDYGTSSTLATYSTVTVAGTTTTQNATVYYNHTGLSVGTVYYFRVRATNALGESTGSILSFTTWSLQTFIQTSSGSFSVSVPSITPTGQSAIAPTIYEMLIYGGGGGANYAGGGGGGYRIAASKTSSSTGTQNVTGTIGAGGGGGNGGGGTGGAGTGGASTLTIGNTTYTANGGTPGAHPGSCASPSGTGGSSGSGDNPSRGGGSNTYGYYYFTGSYNQWTDPSCGCCSYDKLGNCTQYCTCNNPNSPIYAWDCNYYAGGGGGGTDAAGSNAYTQASSSHNGGAGGAGGGAYGLRGGNGGGGRGTQSTGANGSTSGSGPIVGTGGQGWYGAGVAGGVTFKYYGP